jgi:hypothetical protein
MESSRLALPVLVLLVSLTFPLGLANLSPGDPAIQHRRHEVARLRAHFDSVDAELRLSTALPLTPAQRTVRTPLIGWLREYRAAGRFPRNDRSPDRAMPFFRDSRGVLCAMAYLIDRSGRRDLVDRVASTRNNAFIRELAGDPELRTWLDSLGLSVAEAARIQPSYEFPPGEPPPGEPEESAVSASYALTSILVSGTSLATVGVTAIAPSQTAGWAGLIAGSAGLIAGAVKVDEAGTTDDVATANIIAGGGALMFGLYRLLTPRLSGPMDGPASEASGEDRKLSISPLVMPSAHKPRIGLAMHTTLAASAGSL